MEGGKGFSCETPFRHLSPFYLVLVLEFGLVECLQVLLVQLAEYAITLIHANSSLQAIMTKVFLPVSRKLLDVVPQRKRAVGLYYHRSDAVDGQVIRLVQAQVVVVHQVQLGHLVIRGHCMK